MREGVPFREAHEAVGKIVAHCADKRVDLRSLSKQELAGFNPAFPDDAATLLDLDRSLEQRSLAGGTARATVERALADARRELDDEIQTLSGDDSSGGT